MTALEGMEIRNGMVDSCPLRMFGAWAGEGQLREGVIQWVSIWA